MKQTEMHGNSLRERARARLTPLLRLARRIREADDPLGRELRERLARSSPLSAAGVELALADHLEIEVSDTDLDAIVGWCGARAEAAAAPAPRCHVLLSAQVCTAALRAIALALVSADEVLVKPSRRDPELATMLVRELGALGGAAPVSIALVDAIAARAGDELHAYGSDDALASIVRTSPAGVRFRGHGTGFGVAVIGDGAELDAAAKALARDVVVFDQRGCLSPRLALVIGSPARAGRFASLLSAALAAAAASVPRGAVDPDTTAELATFVATMQAIGEVHAHDDHVVAVDPLPAEPILPPPARAVLVAPCADRAGWDRLLAPLGRWITCLGRAGVGPIWLDDALRSCPGARVVELGAMQRPRLDGPVDRRR